MSHSLLEAMALNGIEIKTNFLWLPLGLLQLGFAIERLW
jgi:hypothetical protein